MNSCLIKLQFTAQGVTQDTLDFPDMSVNCYIKKQNRRKLKDDGQNCKVSAA